MIAGGGASVIYSDTICDFGLANELANYGEYSGAPSEVTTFEYARTILSLVTAKGTYHADGKILLIGGGIANFTDVAGTFKGIIRALREFQHLLHEFRVRIYVRRGGPNYQAGLKLMRELGEELDLPIRVFGPETYITAIIPIALEDDRLIRTGVCKYEALTSTTNSQEEYGWSPTNSSAAGKQREQPAWRETFMEDVERDPNFLKRIQSLTDREKLRVETPLPESAPSSAAGTNHQHLAPLLTSCTKCFVYGLQTRAVQEMMDFDHVCGRTTASVTGLIFEFSPSHLRPFYFGTEEVLLPVFNTLKEAAEAHPDVDVLINFASMRSAADVTRRVMGEMPNVRTIAIIAEGVPERTARALRVMAARCHVTLIGPATVGGMKSGGFRIGNTGGSLENIMNARLYRPGSVAFVTKSGGMLNEVNNILSNVSDGTYEGIAIGGDRFPGTSMLEHLLRYEADPKVKILVVLGEVGGSIEYEVIDAMKTRKITKPLVAWCVGTCAPLFSTEVSFGHAGAWAGGSTEHAQAKNKAFHAAGALVPPGFQDFGASIRCIYQGLVAKGIIVPIEEPPAPRVPMDYAWAKRLGLVRRPKGFISSISDDRGEEVVYAGWPISKVLESGMGVGGVIALLWFKRPLPTYAYAYLERVLMLTADHGPAVCGAHNCIVTARAGKDLISSLISGLCTVGDRFGGACDQAAQQFLNARTNGWTPQEFVKRMKESGKLIMGIGHRIKSVHNPDRRVQLLKEFCTTNFAKTEITDYAGEVEKLTTKKKDTLILNVDGLIGVSMCDLLFGCGAFTATEAKDYIDNGCINGLFVLGRSIGFIGHFLDQKRLKQGLYRHDTDDISYVLPDLMEHTPENN
eukprot:GHVT01023330.1.p1 GENE.GHVT01023330.1~~GHVT01023330.1.p1  ORF type:complete len:857 (-),score=210.82 GHVT01023330.1:82-2652(-)